MGACVCPPPNHIMQVYPAMGSPLPSSIDHPQSLILIHDQCLPSSYSVLAKDIYPPPFQLLVGERSCRPSPNHHSFSLSLLSTYTAEGIALLRSAPLITSGTLGITAAPSPYRQVNYPCLLQVIPRVQRQWFLPFDDN